MNGEPLPFPVLTALGPEPKRRLQIVLAVYAGVFGVEMVAGQFAGSQALKADALDFFADSMTFSMSIWLGGRSGKVPALTALIRAACLLLAGLWVAATTLYHFFLPDIPDATTIGAVGIMALAVSGFVLFWLDPFRKTEPALANLWWRARNHVIGNGAVILTAIAVLAMGNRAPDLIVGGVVVTLFLATAVEALRRADRGWRAYRADPPV